MSPESVMVKRNPSCSG